MTHPRRAVRRSLPAALLLMAVGLLTGAPQAEAASWRSLNGRIAPDLVFTETANGLAPGTRLSSFRNQRVVLLVFWLRDCPHCRRELPKVQEAFQLWGRSGLEVITVVHRFPLNQVLPTMAQRGWTFPVARDPTGALAAQYGGGRRPGTYVIGVDGRVKAGPTFSDNAYKTELGRWRIKELGAFPTELNAARNHVYQGDYGSALRSAERIAAAAGASAEVKAAVARLVQIAGRKLQNRVDRAEQWLRGGDAQRARAEYAGIEATFVNTSLETRAKALFDAFKARAGG